MSEDFDAWYRRTSASDAERPAAESTRAILAFARDAAERATTRDEPALRGVRQRRRRLVAGSLAAAAVAGLVAVPLWLSLPSARAPVVQAAKVEEASSASLTYKTPEFAHPPALADASAPPPYLSQLRPSIQSPAAAAAKAAPQKHLSAADLNANDAGAAIDELRMSRQSSARMENALSAGVALRTAAQQGDLPRLQALLAEPVNLELRDADGRTALMWAVINRRIAAVNMLLAHGADPTALDARGRSPAEAAAAAGDRRIGEALRRANSSGTQ